MAVPYTFHGIVLKTLHQIHPLHQKTGKKYCYQKSLLRIKYDQIDSTGNYGLGFQHL